MAVTLRELAWVIHKRIPERAGVGPLPTTEVALLKQVIDGPGQTVGELSAALGLRQPNTSAALRVLTSRGLVVRSADAADRRTSRIHPTEEGRREHEAIAAAWAASVDDALDTLPESDRSALTNAAGALSALARAMHAAE
ncbi:MarR family transcriptional regulator [Microbacterium protaetiae]|uniref:MarR family transcriptional regulator n=1 Tax=Microbacterium protaetiae TaxID=2509458 RepID=A0A4P6EIE2_9MICO|nr:MarR family transcriptional regulator [Microbacterium protaetiae]